MTIPKHLMEAKICNKDTCEEIRTLKEELEKKNKKYWQSKCFEYQVENRRLNNVLNELEKWLKDVDVFQMNFIKNKDHITPYKAVLDKLNELKESDK